MIVSKFHNFKPVEALAKDPYNSKERNKELVLLKILVQKHLLIILKLINSQLTSEQDAVTCSVRGSQPKFLCTIITSTIWIEYMYIHMYLTWTLNNVLGFNRP